ncbi:condensation domain-containing protein [Smaragdicoccus niigatensis]|uniref:condensation domain-containing protein n=1 Tax=Smaragdicoccus niigatensis TaxID=359359 RepID=UPI0003811CDC|nr:condensation domain-containing protein [Smaragdicoccus niigatensis]
MRQARLDFLDEACLNLGSDIEPWSVHFEVRVDGSLDAERVRDAVRQAMAIHPIARARIADWAATDTRYWWHIPDVPGEPTFSIAECASLEDVDKVRSALQSHVPDIRRRGTFEVVLAKSSGGDYLMLNLHHAAGDGMSSYRLMNSIIRNYAGQPDPVPDFDPVTARNVRKLVGARRLVERAVRLRSLLGHLSISSLDPARVAIERGHNEAGYGFHLLKIDRDESARIMSARPDGATVNDLLLAALAVTIRRWNDAHGKRRRRISITMPFNVRPPEWQYEVIGNFASYVTAHIKRGEQSALVAATKAALRRTTTIKTNRTQGVLVDLLAMGTLLPAGIKAGLIAKRPIVGDRAVDTAMLSNLGRLANPDVLGGNAVDVTELWFSPPCTMPMGIGVGAVTVDGEMFLTVRYRHPQFDAAAAQEFSDLFREVLRS